MIDGALAKLQVAHFPLSHSRAFFVNHEMLFDAHYHGFRVFGGVPERGIYDNMKAAVDKISRGKERKINQRFQAMASHYLFEPEFCGQHSYGYRKPRINTPPTD